MKQDEINELVSIRHSHSGWTRADIVAVSLRALLEICFQTHTNRPLLVQTSFLSLRSKCKQEEQCKIKQRRRTPRYIDRIYLKSRCKFTVSLNVTNL